jgi:hypothetical protein
MQIRRGSSRAVFLVGRWAIKVPLVMIPHKKADVEGIWKRFLIGMIANLTEYVMWLVFRRWNFLTPVYFSIGFVSIQKRSSGEKPSWDELNAMWKRMSQHAQMHLRGVDPHQIQPGNVWKEPDGTYRFVDFGDKVCYGGMTLSTFFVYHHEELSKIFNEGVQE